MIIFLGKVKKTITPSQFQHIGIKSSLDGKIQKLKDKSFKEIKNKYNNPEVSLLHSSMPVFQKNSLENAYFGKTGGGYWGTTPKNDSFILIVFEKIEKVQSIKIQSDFSHPQDKLSPGTLLEFSAEEVYPTNLTNAKFEELAEADENGAILVVKDISAKSLIIRLDERDRWVFIDKIIIGLQPETTGKLAADRSTARKSIL